MKILREKFGSLSFLETSFSLSCFALEVSLLGWPDCPYWLLF